MPFALRRAAVLLEQLRDSKPPTASARTIVSPEQSGTPRSAGATEHRREEALRVEKPPGPGDYSAFGRMRPLALERLVWGEEWAAAPRRSGEPLPVQELWEEEEALAKLVKALSEDDAATSEMGFEEGRSEAALLQRGGPARVDADAGDVIGQRQLAFRQLHRLALRAQQRAVAALLRCAAEGAGLQPR